MSAPAGEDFWLQAEINAAKANRMKIPGFSIIEVLCFIMKFIRFLCQGKTSDGSGIQPGSQQR
jgi:hypothetical protein